jgi:hypothetical protein
MATNRWWVEGNVEEVNDELSVLQYEDDLREGGREDCGTTKSDTFY